MDEQRRTVLSVVVILALVVIGLVILEVTALICGRDGVLFSLVVAALVSIGAGFGGFSIAHFWEIFNGRR